MEPPKMEPEDAALWRRVAGATKPLPGRRAASAPPPPPAAVPDEKAAGAAEQTGARARTSPAGRPPPTPPALPPLAPGAAPGLDQRTALRLRRGQLPIDARLDLHGSTLEEASRSLSLFVQDAWESGARCVLVITGKGSRPRAAGASPFAGAAGERAIGVLREALPGWINRPALRPRVLAFGPARPKDGGDGAFYLLLKRRR